MQCASVALVLVAAVAAQVVATSATGFKVSGTKILDSTGHTFVMRGINYAHSWYKSDAEKSIPAIAATGANVIRIVLSNGEQYTKDEAADVQRLLNLCKENKLVAILEVHDATGSDDASKLDRAADYWVNLASLLSGTEDRVIINIANEWFGSSGQAATWAAAYRSVLPKLRAAGLKHLIIVDSAGWGQDASSIAQEGKSIFEADSLRNTIFSIHMYEVAAPDAATVKKHIDNSLAIGVPVIIGEFSDAQNGSPVDYKAILEYTAERNVGWLVWSWYGNNADTANMDLVTDAAGSQLTPIGKTIIEGSLGIRSNAKAAKIW